MCRRASLLVRAVFCCVLGAASAAAQETCWPQDYSPKPSSAYSSAATSQAGPAGNIHVYLDGSGSMSGYVNQPKPGSDGLWILNAMIPSLPSLASAGGGKVYFYRAGDGRAADLGQVDKPLTDQQLKETVRPSWYVGKDAPLDVPLAQAVTRPPQDVTIVVTDLFLSDAEMAGESFYALRRPMATALRENRSIGILGIRHNFNGTIYDIPGAVSQYRDASVRPLMLLMVGPAARILALKERFDTEFLRERPEQSRFILFTPATALGFRGLEHWGDRYLGPTQVLSPTRAFEPSLANTKIPQVEFSKKAEAVGGQIALGDLWQKHGLYPGGLRVETRLWRLANRSGKCEDRWELTEIQSPALTASMDATLNVKFEILPEESREDADVGRHLVVSQFTLSGLQLGPTGRWLTEWGFNQQEADSLVAKKPKFFPALNLSRIGNALRDVLAEAARDTPVAEIAIGINLKR